MCGNAGIWYFNNGTSRNTLVQEVSAMADRLHSRGPDSTGYWVDEEKGIAFSHKNKSDNENKGIAAIPVTGIIPEAVNGSK